MPHISALEVEFEGYEITLDIAKEGVVLPDGWKITPCSHPRVILSKPINIQKKYIHIRLSVSM